MILDKINNPNDLKFLNKNEIKQLAEEIRGEILKTVSKNGGHLSSNLGIVELTIALHRVFSSPDDKIIFDVGHQSYTHKLLTGRREQFNTLRQKNGISGFAKRGESPHDCFGSGHSSNALSAALGIAAGMKLNGCGSHAAAVVGDGAFTGGMVYEALNNCADKKLNLILVLNDNGMSISRNVGTLNKYFARFRTSSRYLKFKQRFESFFSVVPLVGKPAARGARSLKNWLKRRILNENFFEQLGIFYFGPVRGDDTKRLEYILNEAKRIRRISVIHVITKKGMGYKFAEEHPDLYHSVGKFDLETGIVSNGKEQTYSYNFGKIITEKARADSRICAVTAAMTDGTGLEIFAKNFSDRFFDVGIAEGHAATFCGGLAIEGKIPVFAVYSTFFQRCYDQVLEDIALQSLPAVFAIDRAGIIGDDGATHHGIYDAALFAQIPGTVIYAPDSLEELEVSFTKAIESGKIAAVRYPKTKPEEYNRESFIKSEDLAYADFGGNRITIISYGRIVKNAVKAAEALADIGVRVIKMTKIFPVNVNLISELLNGTQAVLFAEEGVKNGGIGEILFAELGEKGYLNNIKTQISAIDNCFVTHGDTALLLDEIGLSAEKLVEKALEMIDYGEN